ncbi:dockerin type I repeat-containing protein [uncultured Ruminococcus sp.]|uniref:dockerin type I repeat-containing protein n=1 Tax=uncultured Ruminococcus sp. TaxID=165186 RepID=UPI0025FD1471|nr:dockerin type I repeat-containing protein [uncultured Ruminococcus sp.]
MTNQTRITADAVTLSASSYVYDGTAKQPSVTVKVGSKTLTKGTDYTAVYSDNTAAGTAYVTIRGMGAYTGSVTKNFTISKKSISNLTMNLSQTSYTYDGTAKKPKVTVKDGSRTLVSGTDYSVSYSNNTNAGTASVTVTGKGNYTGTASLSFKIVKKGESNTIVKGDVNGDGSITITDITKAAAHAKGKKLLSAEEQQRADINGDGVVNVTDITRIAAHVKGKKLLN